MDYYSKYLKYKKKYLELKGGAQFINFLEEINNIDEDIKNILNNWKELNKDELTKINDVDIRTYFKYIILDEVLCPFIHDKFIMEKYYNIIHTLFDHIEELINNIVNSLNNIKKERELENIKVIAPGDSPYKIVKIIQKLDLAPFCEFIQFPASKLGRTAGVLDMSEEQYNSMNQKKYKYIEKKLPDDFNSVVFIDFIASASGIKNILEIYKKKLEEKKLTNTEDINTIDELIKIITEDKGKYTLSLRSNVFFNNYVININNNEHLFATNERNDLRCIQTFETYNEEELILPFNNIRCELFIYAYIIFELNKEKVSKILKDPAFINEIQILYNTQKFISRQLARKIRFPDFKVYDVINSK
jgi:hypothetical protein